MGTASAGPLPLRLDARDDERGSEVAAPDAVFLAAGCTSDAREGPDQPQVRTGEHKCNFADPAVIIITQ